MPLSQNYQPVRPHTSDVFPGFTFGGPILKDKIFGFVGIQPGVERHRAQGQLSVPGSGFPDVGVVPFSRNQQTYYTTARVDAAVTQKVRVFGSWLYQYQRENGVNLPASDSTTGLC